MSRSRGSSGSGFIPELGMSVGDAIRQIETSSGLGPLAYPFPGSSDQQPQKKKPITQKKKRPATKFVVASKPSSSSSSKKNKTDASDNDIYARLDHLERQHAILKHEKQDMDERYQVLRRQVNNLGKDLCTLEDKLEKQEKK